MGIKIKLHKSTLQNTLPLAAPVKVEVMDAEVVKAAPDSEYSGSAESDEDEYFDISVGG